MSVFVSFFIFFFFNDPAPTEIYPLSLHDALPISSRGSAPRASSPPSSRCPATCCASRRSEEHTSELQSRLHLVCRLLLEKKKIKMKCVSARRALCIRL